MNLKDLPDINFVDKDIETILAEIVRDYEEAYFKQTKKRKKLYPGDPIRIFLYSQALREYQLRQMIDYSAKQNLLKYAEGDNLTLLAADRGVNRLKAKKAKVPVKFVFSMPLPTTKYIPKGIRVTSGNNIFFQLPEGIEIEAGTKEEIIIMKCTKEGTIGNGFLPGQINTLVDPIPFVESVVNTEESQGGAEIEDNETLRERAWLAPEGFSVAGPDGAYIFWAKQYSPSIIDVFPFSPSPGVVDIRVLLRNGEIPQQTFLEGLKECLSAKDKRPLTDNVQISAPEIINYDLDVTYYVSSEKQTVLDTAKEKIEKAVEEYKLWQRSKIGRNIDPSELVFKMKKAGASRVKVSSPVFKEIEKIQVAISQNCNVVFGGIEDV